VIRHHGHTVFGAMNEWVAQKRIPPVLLLTGTTGCGKRSMAYWLSQWILCERNGLNSGTSSQQVDDDPFTANLFGSPDPAPAPEDLKEEMKEKDVAIPTNGTPGPCGQCAGCVRALNGNWVDFTEVLPEGSEEGSTTGTLKVDQFREIKQKLGFGAHEGAYRIVLIPNADRMTVQAANSVLKLLEEPPPGWIFFLTASDPTLVLPTILSRCQQLRLKPFQPRELDELLELSGVGPERRKICAELAQGSWSKALTLSGEEIWDHRQSLFGFIQEPASVLASLVDWASQEPRHFDLLVDQLEQLTGELIRWSVSPSIASPETYAWVNTDGKNALSQHAKAVTKRQGTVTAAREFWIERAERLARSRQESLAPLNRKLLIQDLLLPWLEAM
jgi:DNA polymerase III delta prime subunit